MKKLNSIFLPYINLPKELHIIAFAVIINQLGNFVGPFLTLFLTIKVGLPAHIVGILVALSAGFGLIGSIIGGNLIDEFGRKRILVIFRLTAAFIYIICAFVSNSIILVILLMLSNLIGGVSIPILSTIITDLTEGEERKLAFSLNYLSINIGFAVGPLLASFLYENHLFLLFIGDGLTTILSVLLILIYIPETKPIFSKELKHIKNESLLKMLFKNPILIIFSLVIVVNFIGFSQFKFGIPLQIISTFGIGSTHFYGILMTINAIVCFVFTIPVTSILKNNKNSYNIVIGNILYAIGFGLLFFSNYFVLFIISTIIWTFGEIIVSINTGIYIAEHAPITHRGRFNSLFPIIRKTGSMLGPILAGLAINFTNINTLWLFICGLLLFASFVMYRLYIVDLHSNLDNEKIA